MSIKTFAVTVPADVPKKMKQRYIDNYLLVTKNTGNLLLFCADQKIEHLNADFYGVDIHPDAMHPGHIFEIAASGSIGALATHPGLIARYGLHYPSVPYVVKLNGNTHLVPLSMKDPSSAQLATVADIVNLQSISGLMIAGIGVTVYLSSAYEDRMLERAAQAIIQAHEHGLLAIVWLYVQGSVDIDHRVPDLVAGIAGIGVSLGADFIKVKAPVHAEGLRIASIAAGNTKVLCAGGSMRPFKDTCETLHAQMHIGGSAGGAIGRTIFQCSRDEAIARTYGLSALVYEQVTVETALERYHEKLLHKTA